MATKQQRLPTIDGVPDIWVSLKFETPMTPREFRFVANALGSKLTEWLAELAPGKGNLVFMPGHEVYSHHCETIGAKVAELRQSLSPELAKEVNVKAFEVIEKYLKEDAETVRKAWSDGLAPMDPGKQSEGQEDGAK